MGNTTTALSTELLRVYSREKLFDPCERSLPRFWNEMQEAKDERPGGSGLRFRIIGATGHAVGNPAESGDYSDTRTRLQVECAVTPARIDSVIELSETFLDAAKGDGSYSGDAEHDAIVEATKSLFSYAQRLLACGHGTGRLAIVEANTVASTTFVAKRPESVFQLRNHQPIEFVDTDTGGSVQGGVVLITDVNYLTRTVTIDTARSLTADWGVYQAGVYGNPMPNGVRNIVDDGDFRSSIFGVSAAAPNTFLNATVLDNGNTLQDYSEELVRDLFDQVTFKQEMVPNCIRTNSGLASEHYRLTTSDRVYNVDAGGKLPDYNFGANHENLAFQYGSVKVPWKIDRDLPSRELYALYLPAWRRHTLRKADWFGAEGGAAKFDKKPANAGGTWSYALIGSMLMNMTISCRRLNANGKLGWVRDRGSARDS